MRVTLETDRHYIRFGDITIIQADLGANGLDPLNQRTTIGVRAEIGGQHFGFWFDTSHLRPEEAIYALGQSLMDFAQDPFAYALAQSYTPEGIVYAPADFESLSPSWQSGEVPAQMGAEESFGTDEWVVPEGDEDAVSVA